MKNKLYHYKKCGLDYIYLMNGFEVQKTPYGTAVSITSADELHQVIAREIVVSDRPIRGMELRFLRSLLDVSQSDLAKILKSSRPTIARWESKSKDPIKGAADTALRLLYTASIGGCPWTQRVLEMLRDGDDSEHELKVRKKTTLALGEDGAGWDTAQAA